MILGVDNTRTSRDIENIVNSNLKFTGDYLNIPVDLIIYAIGNKITNPLRLFIALKSEYNGQLKVCKGTIENACCRLNYRSKKTFKSNFRWLLLNNWVYSRKGYYILKSFQKLSIPYTCSSGVLYYHDRDGRQFKNFIHATALTFLASKKRHSSKSSGLIKWRPYMQLYYEMTLPVTYIMKGLNVSKGTSFNIKKSAIQSGYVSFIKNCERTNIDSSTLKLYKKYSNDPNKDAYWSYRQNVFKKKADLFNSKLQIVRNKQWKDRDALEEKS